MNAFYIPSNKTVKHIILLIETATYFTLYVNVLRKIMIIEEEKFIEINLSTFVSLWKFN